MCFVVFYRLYCHIIIITTIPFYFAHVMFACLHAGAFLLYTCLAFIGCIFVFAFVPETKGKRLEEIEQLFAKPLCSSRS